MSLGKEVVWFGKTTHIVPPWVCVAVWMGLIGLTGLSFGLSFVALGSGSIAVAIGIALVKSTLVVVFFMHVLEERGAGRLALPVAVTLIFVLGLFVIFDVKTRFAPAIAGEGELPPRSWAPQEFRSPAVPPTPLPTDLMRPGKVGGSQAVP